MPLADQEVRERVSRLEARLEALESIADPAARAAALESVQGLLELYGEGLARILKHAARAEGSGLATALAEDEWVAHLLLLHGLHPLDVETRVRQALDEVRPYLGSHGGDVELLRVEKGTAYLRLQGSCSGCPSSTLTLRTAVEEAIRKRAPELAAVEAEGALQPAAAVPAANAVPAVPALVQLGAALAARGAP